MKEKSLIYLLEEENSTVQDYNLAKENAKQFLDMMQENKYSADACKGIANSYEKVAQEKADKLVIIRKNIREHIKRIMDMEEGQ